VHSAVLSLVDMGIYLSVLINVSTLLLNVISFQKPSDFLAHPVYILSFSQVRPSPFEQYNKTYTNLPCVIWSISFITFLSLNLTCWSIINAVQPRIVETHTKFHIN